MADSCTSLVLYRLPCLYIDRQPANPQQTSTLTPSTKLIPPPKTARPVTEVKAQLENLVPRPQIATLRSLSSMPPFNGSTNT